MNSIFVLRGDTFRDTKQNQISAYNSIINNVINPLKKSNDNIYIYVVTYEHQNNKILNYIFKKYNFKLVIKKKSTQPNNFIESINSIDTDILNNCDFVLILRNDLYFIQDIDYTRLSPNKILFQWNLFHQTSTKEMADQIHFIGGNLIKEFKNKINNNKIDIQWDGTLHNLYNFCLKYFGEENISYLNYIENPNPYDDICKIRGNPSVQFGNNLYTYTRFM